METPGVARTARLFTFKDNIGTDITVDLECVFCTMLPSFLALKPEQRNQNVASAFFNLTKIDLTHAQVEKIRNAWFEYHSVPKPSPFDVGGKSLIQ